MSSVILAIALVFWFPSHDSPVGGWPIGSIGDYFGLPTVGQVASNSSVSHSALPLRAYNLIYLCIVFP